MVFQRGYNTTVGKIWYDGSMVQYAQTSDRRLKMNIQPLTDGLAVIDRLQPVTFEMIAAPGIRRTNFVAQDVAQVVPEAVGGDSEGVDADGNVVPMHMDVARLVPFLRS